MSVSQPFLERMPEDNAAWQARIAQGGCFVIAEASINDAVPWLAERWGGSLEQTRLYWGETGRVHASVSPYCIPLHAANWPQVKEHIVIQPGWGMGLQLEWFMQAYSPLDQLLEVTKHLRQWNLVASPSGENAILRVGDWQVVNQLLSASSAQEACALYGPIARFCDISPDGAVTTLNLTTREPHSIPDILPRQLSDEQWQAIMVPAEHQNLARYMEHLRTYHTDWQHASDDELQVFTRQQAELAQHNGFNNDRDIVRWLALATELSPAFIHQPWAKNILVQPEYLGTQSRMDRLYQAAIDHLDEA
ncbi:DUF4123 domain-containing protein [Pectobacterium parmentieri]|uniref:DUF4123 domain-containing protein n=1 Tax=Pectobacterium parmentieri TaxID=1905730 RepID=UPI0018DFDE5E|nr:DUF4123 domain-containing protein [Pectobacterium parmentieri]MBI0561695.1 DUF4123 domain-containing protein [Pectobacterium parmentieri]MBI0565981.1 DUF4123 domain-containing protein [Pectobacterium parmentieri]QQA75761.1 DUF4123 domain-containing protein [Pectobacterium parmentieri]